MKISVIMPAFNAEKFIARAIRSVIAQTFSDFEVIVIDDGSVDSTREIAEGFAKQDKRIHVLHEENRGTARARNNGLDIAQGLYVSFLDADDCWEPEFLVSTFERAQETDAKFIYSWAEEQFTDGERKFIGDVRQIEGKMDSYLHESGEYRQPFHTCSVLISRDIIENNNIRFPEGIKYSEDTAFFLQVLSVTKAVCVPRCLVYYCRNDNSTMASEWKASEWAGTVEIFERIGPFVAEHYPKGWSAFCTMRAFRAYRFILDCLKRGFISEAETYIVRWHDWLDDFSKGDGRIQDRIKCMVMMQGGVICLKLLGRI